MIDRKQILAIVPARGGSKGVPRKNIRMLAGKPLLAWTIDQAKRSKYIDRLVLSSEDEAIIRIAREWGCEAPFVRPPELARDTTPGIAPVIHCLETLTESYAYVVLLQPTSPMRLAEDIDGCIGLCHAKNAPASVSCVEAGENPYWMFRLDAECNMKPLLASPPPLRRQELPKVYLPNGAVYVGRPDWIREHRTFIGEGTLGYVMPRSRSVDIDTELDLTICDLLLQKGEAPETLDQ